MITRIRIIGWFALMAAAGQLNAQSWDVTVFPPDPITDARQAKAVLESTSGVKTALSVVCDGADRQLAILMEVNTTFTPKSRSGDLYFGPARLRFDKRPATALRVVISEDLKMAAIDEPTTRRLLPTLLTSRELWIQLPIEHVAERVQFQLPEDTKDAIAPVTGMCRAQTQPSSSRQPVRGSAGVRVRDRSTGSK